MYKPSGLRDIATKTIFLKTQKTELCIKTTLTDVNAEIMNNIKI